MMRRPVVVLPIVAILFLSGCTQDEYFIERRYYQVQRQANAIFNNPEATPPQEMSKAIEALNEFLSRYPKSNVAVNSQFTIVRIYIATQEFDEAHRQLQKIMKVFAGSDIVLAEAMFMRGKVFEAQKDWGKALGQYQLLIRDYPITSKAMETPVYIAMRYKEKMQPDKMIPALREAIAYYNSLADKYPSTPLSLQCRTLIVQCYVELNESEKAIAVLEASIKEFKGKVPVDPLMLNIAGIYYTQLKDVPKATAMLEKIVQEFPKASSAQAARHMLDNIKAGKDLK